MTARSNFEEMASAFIMQRHMQPPEARRMYERRELAVLLRQVQEAERERCAKICEAMVVGGRAWTTEQEAAAGALFGAAQNIRAVLLPGEGEKP